MGEFALAEVAFDFFCFFGAGSAIELFVSGLALFFVLVFNLSLGSPGGGILFAVSSRFINGESESDSEPDAGSR